MFSKSGILPYLGDSILRTLVIRKREGEGGKSEGRWEKETEKCREKQKNKVPSYFPKSYS